MIEKVWNRLVWGWFEDAEAVILPDDLGLLGEDENGRLLIPKGRPSRIESHMFDAGYWAPFQPWNPRHWRYYLRSRLQGRYQWLTFDPRLPASQDT